MPELPEVETTIRGLKYIIGEKIYNLQIHTKQLRFKIPINIKKILINAKISNIRRIAKYIIIDLDNMFSLIIHLGMSGRLKFGDLNKNKLKHDHFILDITNKYRLIFNDPRKFGFIDITKTNKLINKNYISNLGLDALDLNLNYKYLFNKISRSEVPVKQILLNQQIISGIGNIYASEILFDAKISPLRKGKDLKTKHYKSLIQSIRKILKKAIKYGGSSIRDYRASDGTLGNFQSNFKVYSMEGKKNGIDTVVKIVQYGRSTYYCPRLQN